MNKSRLTHRISRAALTLVFALFSATTAWADVVTLDENSGEVTLQNGDVLTGTGGENTQVEIADGATVTLSGVTITAYYNNHDHQRPGITCLGDAVIVLAEGTTNEVKGGYDHSGIYIPQGHTLTLQGSGTLNATGGDRAAGIGSGYSSSPCGDITINGGIINATGGICAAGIGSGTYSSCGDITISGGTVTATSSEFVASSGAGIGSGASSDCGNITISGGTVTANGGEGGAGIGSGFNSSCENITISGGIVTANGGWGGPGIGSGHQNCTCGDITINGGTVNANGGYEGAGIGSGQHNSSCGDITISGGTVTANGGNHGAGIGGGYDSSCGNITISGGTVTANGGNEGAGIGSGYWYSSCGDITITNGVTCLVATKGQNCNNTIGAGNGGSSCGTVTIGGVVTGFITQSPYTYPANVKLLTSGTGYMLLQNGDILTGTGGTNTHVEIADGATVTLSGVNITAINWNHQWAGITCLGDAVIVLAEGMTNDVKGGYFNPGIFVPQGHTLTLQGSGTLNATGGESAAGIGSGYSSSPCGNITISGGTVNATGDEYGAGIGSGDYLSSCGSITISGGTVNATGGDYAAGIGSGCSHSSCGDITISGGTVNATGGQYAAGIGSGCSHSSCGDITITDGVTMVTATAGQNCSYAIGAGVDSSCQTVTIGGVETGFITQSPFTTYPYTVSFNANGGTGEMANMNFMYGFAQNLTANSFTNWGKTFDGWATSPDGDKVYDDGQSVSNLTQTPGDTVTLYAKWITDISVDGDEYTIYTSTGWDLFCDLLADNSNGYFTGKTVKLDADISVTRMAGGSDHAFSGTFDGQGHTLTVSYTTTEQYTAPFRCVNGATITNLVTAGTISTSKKFASGMVGQTEGGTVSITNCASNVTINSSVNGDGTHGGFVALASYGTLNITGCTFSGQMLGENTINCGGFVGWTESNNNVTTTITDCLFAPTNLEIHSGYTFSRARNMNTVTVTNSYYTEPLGTPQGIHGITFATAWPAGEAISTYDVSGLTTYANGIQHGDTFYTNPDLNFSVDGDEYTIHTPTGWEMFCDSLAINSYGFFTGKTVKLADNFDNSATPTTRMAVTSGHDFSGTFDGNGKTLHVNITATGNYVGAFLYAIPQGNDTVVFKNLKVTGTISTAYKHAGGILGGQEGKVRIINCESNVTINSTRSGDGTHGGFVGVTSTGELIIEGCAFTGKILTTGTTATTNCAGFVGWRNNNCTATITNSIYAPATLEAGETEASTYSGTFIRNGSPGDNCYYTRTLGSAQGIHAVSNPDIQPSGDPTATYNVSGLTAYGNGLKHGTTFYYNPNNNFVLDIEGYDYVSNPGGWYLIASPVTEAIAPSADNGFITNEFDLYFFDPSFVGEEWRNYKDENFLLTNGTGYLYASEIATTLVFTGTPYTGSGEIELAYDLASPDLAGWNLVGNPFPTTAYVDRDFYVMNSTGTEIIAAEGNTVEAMEGIFVVADGNDETVTFSPMTRGTNQQEERIVLNLSRNNGTVIDRAIVRFGEGKPFPKFQMNPSHTKVYIPQEGEDYAIVSVSAGTDGACTVSTMPVNFKAEHNGTYTLTFSSENIDFDYLHLIDNMTGADVDLLVPNGGDAINRVSTYTFEAKTTDYESRFKLVFNTNEDGPSTGSGAFAYIYNGDIIIYGEGLLQVIDMQGHVILSGDAMNRVSTGGMTAGVYVLRLINGNDVKTQKIVIE